MEQLKLKLKPDLRTSVTSCLPVNFHAYAVIDQKCCDFMTDSDGWFDELDGLIDTIFISTMNYVGTCVFHTGFQRIFLLVSTLDLKI